MAKLTVWTGGAVRLAVTAVALAGTAVLAGCEDDERSDSADPPKVEIAEGEFDPDVPTWTVGSTLHTPDASYDLGTEVLAYVRTSVGIVFVAEYEEFVYSWTSGEPVKIGETGFGGQMLYGDPESPYVGWHQRFAGDGRVVVYDQRQGRRVLTERRSSELVAIDGKDVYLRYQFFKVGIRRIGRPGTERVEERVVAAEEGVRAFNIDTGMLVGSDQASARPLDVRDDPTTAVFSPDGRWVITNDGALEVFDVRTGERRDLEYDGDLRANGFEWLDAHTFLAQGTEDFSKLSLLECDVTTATCSLVIEVPVDFEHGPLVAFADGTSLWATWN